MRCVCDTRRCSKCLRATRTGAGLQRRGTHLLSALLSIPMSFPCGLSAVVRVGTGTGGEPSGIVAREATALSSERYDKQEERRDVRSNLLPSTARSVLRSLAVSVEVVV
jgi:hypothetical protein